MKIPTKSGTSMYHLTIDGVEPKLSFNQSPPHHILTMNVVFHGINQNKTKLGLLEAKPPQLSTTMIPPPWSDIINTNHIDLYLSCLGLQELVTQPTTF